MVGLTLKMFSEGVVELVQEGQKFVKYIFDFVKEGRSYLGWEGFVKAMTILLTKDLETKISMFIKIIDTNNSGILTWDRAKEICCMSMSRFNQDEKKFIPEMGEFITTLIFRIFKAENEIKFDDLKDKFFTGSQEEKFLIGLFCCTDLDK
jgi:hypothetical protein